MSSQDAYMSSQDAYMSSQDADTRKLDLRRNEIHNKLKTVMDNTERQILMAEYGNILKQIQVAQNLFHLPTIFSIILVLTLQHIKIIWSPVPIVEKILVGAPWQW